MANISTANAGSLKGNTTNRRLFAGTPADDSPQRIPARNDQGPAHCGTDDTKKRRFAEGRRASVKFLLGRLWIRSPA